MSVALKPLGWRVQHFGMFWEQNKADFPTCEAKPPAQQGVDGLDLSRPVQIEFNTEPDFVRCWYIEPGGNGLIQIQRDRFMLNWRDIDGGEKYPRYYKRLRPRFEKEWGRFCGFVEAQKIGPCAPQGCEMTYINLIPTDDAFRVTDGDIDGLGVLKHWHGQQPGAFLPAPLTVGINLRYKLPEDKGSMTVVFHPAINTATQTKAIQLRLLVSTTKAMGTLDELLAWFDLAHTWIVRGFTELTTDSMHKIWGRKK